MSRSRRRTRKQRWADLSDERRQVVLEARWAKYAEHYPERVVVIEATQARITAGELVAELCADHGPMRPAYDWDQGIHVGWRCYSCRSGS